MSFLTHLHVCFLPPQSEKNAFFVADLGVIMRQHVRWRTHMTQIRPFYAVRCNSSPVVIEVLAALGTGFICTNKVPHHMIDHFDSILPLSTLAPESTGTFQILSKHLIHG